jgi:hypothetical protein
VRLMWTIISVPNCPKQPSTVLTCLIPFPFSLPYAPHHAERLQGWSLEHDGMRLQHTTVYICLHLPNSQGRISGVGWENVRTKERA